MVRVGSCYFDIRRCLGIRRARARAHYAILIVLSFML